MLLTATPKSGDVSRDPRQEPHKVSVGIESSDANNVTPSPFVNSPRSSKLSLIWVGVSCKQHIIDIITTFQILLHSRL